MEFATSSVIIEKCLQQLTELLLPFHEFLNELNKFNEVVQIKSTKNLTKENSELRMKLENRRKKETKINEKLLKVEERFKKELELKNNIVLQNCFLIIQEQQNHCEVMAKEKLISQHKIYLNEKKLKRYKEGFLNKIDVASVQNEDLKRANMQFEKEERDKWLNTKEILSETLLKYDSEMMEKQNELEFIYKIKSDEEKELQHYKITCTSQEIIYHELMNEKNNYEKEIREKKLYEIRLKFAKRTIVKFIEQHYPAWKKRKLRASKKKSKYRFNLKPK